ncbi:hypothetical protein Daus18300_013681 [Diaporthe australafricana]|uniref:Uncharacterized protein n=1 Tax=Diaporthe australafricana TaxID=127596 RepID=A0ABR3VY55_9PEZI
MVSSIVAAVWLQLVAPEDDEFHIRIEGPDQCPHEHADEDFPENGDGDGDEDDDSYAQEEDEDLPDQVCCLEEDMKIPLQDPLEDVYVGFNGVN